jgi:hypothetical protein
MPGEATMRMVREHPEVLDRMAWNLWAPIAGYASGSRKAAEAWAALSDHDRETWRDRCYARLAEETAQHDAEHPPRGPDDDPNGGLPLPIARIA